MTIDDTATERRTIQITLRTVVSTAVVATLVAIAVTFAVLWHSAAAENSEHAATVDAVRRAEQVATDYAVGAATVDYQNFPAWLSKLKAGTAPVLASKFDATGPALQQLLTPLRWHSTATPIAATVRSESGGRYRVDVFLDVNSTSAQTPDGVRTTVNYQLTVDRAAEWQITDVAGMDGALPVR